MNIKIAERLRHKYGGKSRNRLTDLQPEEGTTQLGRYGLVEV